VTAPVRRCAREVPDALAKAAEEGREGAVAGPKAAPPPEGESMKMMETRPAARSRLSSDDFDRGARLRAPMGPFAAFAFALCGLCVRVLPPDRRAA
jgi:hypothetical protein